MLFKQKKQPIKEEITPSKTFYPLYKCPLCGKKQYSGYGLTDCDTCKAYNLSVGAIRHLCDDGNVGCMMLSGYTLKENVDSSIEFIY